MLRGHVVGADAMALLPGGVLSIVAVGSSLRGEWSDSVLYDLTR